MSEFQPMGPVGRVVVIAFVLVMVVPMFLAGLDTSPAAIIALSALPAGWLSWKLYQCAMEFTY